MNANVRTISGLRVGGPSLSRAESASAPLREKSGPKRLIAAVHGILARATIPSWPDKFAVWMADRDVAVHVIEKEYIAGPFPAWNVWAKNWFLAYSLAAELELWSKDGWEVSIVAHSNGCDIAEKTARELARRKVKLEALVLIGAAAQADVEKSGVAELFRGGFVNRAIAYASPQDKIVSNVMIWPYGRLGHLGWTLDGQPYNARLTPHEPAPEAAIITRWFPTFGHCDYFADANRSVVFEQIYQDVCNPCPL